MGGVTAETRCESPGQRSTPVDSSRDEPHPPPPVPHPSVPIRLCRLFVVRDQRRGTVRFYHPAESPAADHEPRLRRRDPAASPANSRSPRGFFPGSDSDLNSCLSLELVAMSTTGGMSTAARHRQLRDRTRDRQRNSSRNQAFDRCLGGRLPQRRFGSLTKFSPGRDRIFHSVLHGHRLLVAGTVIIISRHLWFLLISTGIAKSLPASSPKHQPAR